MILEPMAQAVMRSYSIRTGYALPIQTHRACLLLLHRWPRKPSRPSAASSATGAVLRCLCWRTRQSQISRTTGTRRHAPDDACRTKPDFPGGMAQNVGASLDLFCVEPAQYGDGSCRQADVYHDHCCGCSTVFCHARRLLAGATNHTTYSKFG